MGFAVTVIVVTSTTPGGGKTGVASAIARHYAYAGRRVRLARISDDGLGNASNDAKWFASLDFAPGSSAEPVAPGSVGDPGGDEVVVLEAPPTAANVPGAKVVVVARHEAPGEMPEGIQPVAIVVTDVLMAHPGTPPGGVPVVDLREDRTLAGFSVSEAKAALNAEVLVEGDAGDPTCDHLVISPISSDAGQPFFRRFPSKAVVVRFDRTDMHLAALKAEPNVLILTGGRKPMDYLFDAATSQGVPVLLSRTDTENTVIALEGIFDHTRFQGERKLERMTELLEGSGLYDALGI